MRAWSTVAAVDKYNTAIADSTLIVQQAAETSKIHHV